MKPLAVLMAVYNEADLMPRAIDSLLAGGIAAEDIHVFDGAWRGGKNGSHAFAGSAGPSTDDTVAIAEAKGCTVHTRADLWPSQEAKRQAMFDDVQAQHYLVFDADEELIGDWPDELPAGHANMMIRCVGPNDMPGIRGVWPNGDYCADYKPELRVFANRPDLEILYPGGYFADGALIQAYADMRGTSALPVVTTAVIDHHGNDRSAERIAQKIDYYHAEHPERKAWQKALNRTL